jgi:hypothetical protein
VDEISKTQKYNNTCSHLHVKAESFDLIKAENRIVVLLETEGVREMIIKGYIASARQKD